MRTKHLLCYCSSLPGTPCDFCAGTRVGTLDDYRDALRPFVHDPVFRAAPQLREALEGLVRAVAQRFGYATSQDTWPAMIRARAALAAAEGKEAP